MKDVIITDGNCGFCQFSMRLLSSMNPSNWEIITQSDPQVAHLRQNIESKHWDVDSIQVVSGNQLLVKSKAISFLMKKVYWYYQPLRLIFFLPVSLLDKCYDFVARNRYLWKSNCTII